jgi:hypothetical protein
MRPIAPPEPTPFYTDLTTFVRGSRMGDLRTVFTTSLFAMILFAGCVAGEAEDTGATDNASATLDAGAGVDTESAGPAGSIQGTVRDDELKPLSGAGVALLKTAYSLQSDEAGAFAFVNLPVGEYTIIAQKLGYESKAQKVIVVEGETVWLNLTLVAIVTSEVYTDTSQHNTQLQCMLSTSAWVSSCSYPYTAVYLTAHNNGVNLSNYGAPADIMTNKWRYNYSVAKGVQNIVSEMKWTAVSEAAKLMQLRMCVPNYDAVLDDCPNRTPSKAGTSPITNPWEPTKSLWDAPHAGWVMAAVWPAFPDATSTAQGVFLEQKVEMWNTEFYGEASPEGWSVFTAG